MAKKTSRISINKLESTVKANTIVVHYTDDIEVTIRKTLPLQDVLSFVSGVVDSCIDKDTGVYLAEVKQFAIYASLLTEYANFTLPSNTEKQYELIYNTDAVDFVLKYIDVRQYEEICDAIDARIEHELCMIRSEASHKLNVLIAKFEELIQKSTEMFEGLGDADMAAIAKSLSAIENVDEKALAHAVLDVQNENRDKVAKDNVVPIRTDEIVVERD